MRLFDFLKKKPEPTTMKVKTPAEMTEAERQEYFMELMNEPSTAKRLEGYKELEKLGDVAAKVKLADLYMDLGSSEQLPPWDDVTRLYSEAAEAGSGMAMFNLAMVNMNGANPGADPVAGAQQICKAIEMDMPVIEYIPQMYENDKNPKLNNFFHKIFEKPLADLAQRMEAENSSKAWRIIGSMYFYGVHYQQNYDTAKQWLEKAAAAGDYEARDLLKNPLFDDNNEE